MVDADWTAEGKPLEQVTVVERFLQEGKGTGANSSQQQGCKKCGNPKATKWCPCQMGEMIKPSELIPGKYSLYLVRGAMGDLEKAPPHLACDSAGLNDTAACRTACSKFLQALPAREEQQVAAASGEESGVPLDPPLDQEEQQETHPPAASQEEDTLVEESWSHEQQGREQQEEAAQEPHDEEIPTQKPSVYQDPPLEQEEQHEMHHPAARSQEEDALVAESWSHEQQVQEQQDQAQEEAQGPLEITQEAASTNGGEVLECGICCEALGNLVCSFECCTAKVCLNCIVGLIKSKEELSKDPMGSGETTETDIYPETGQSPHGRPLNCMQCQKHLDCIDVILPNGDIVSFNTSPLETRDITRQARLILVEEWEAMIDFWAECYSDNALVATILRGYTRETSNTCSARQAESRTARCGEILDVLRHQGELGKLRILLGHSPGRLFGLIHAATGLALKPEEQETERAGALLEAVVKALCLPAGRGY